MFYWWQKKKKKIAYSLAFFLKACGMKMKEGGKQYQGKMDLRPEETGQLWKGESRMDMDKNVICSKSKDMH